MENKFSKFLRENFTSGGREVKRQERDDTLVGRLEKNYGVSLWRGGYGPYGPSASYAQHDKIKDIYFPRDRLNYVTRNQFFIDTPILRMVITKKVQETNRNGVSVKKLFVRKCMREYIEPCENKLHQLRQDQGKEQPECGSCPDPDLPLGQEECGEEFDTDVVICAECQFPTRPPKHEQKRFLIKALRTRNKYKRSVPEILKAQGLDAEKHDNGFMVSDFLYAFKPYPDGSLPFKPTSKKWIQSYNGQPEFIRPIISFDGDLGNSHFTCIYHRKDAFIKINLEEDNLYNENHPMCTQVINDKKDIVCGQPLQVVEYVYMRHHGRSSDAAVDYAYLDGEVQHVKIYSPGTAMGISLMDSLYYILLQLNGMDKWIAEYYLKQRMFKGFFDIPRMASFGHENVQTMFQAEFTKWRQDQWYVPMFSSPLNSSGIKFNRIDDSPKEMQFIENNEKASRTIATAYGISNVFMNDTSTGAGLNNQGLELATTNRVVADAQFAFDEQILKPWCASIQSIDIEDLEYFIGYETNEEQDLMAEKQRFALDIASASAAQQLGAKVTINAGGEFVISPQKEGEALIPMDQKSGLDFENVEGMNHDGQSKETRSQSKPVQSAPNEPSVQGSSTTSKGMNGGLNDAINKLTDMLKKAGVLPDD